MKKKSQFSLSRVSSRETYVQKVLFLHIFLSNKELHKRGQIASQRVKPSEVGCLWTACWVFRKKIFFPNCNKISWVLKTLDLSASKKTSWLSAPLRSFVEQLTGTRPSPCVVQCRQYPPESGELGAPSAPPALPKCQLGTLVTVLSASLCLWIILVWSPVRWKGWTFPMFLSGSSSSIVWWVWIVSGHSRCHCS